MKHRSGVGVEKIRLRIPLPYILKWSEVANFWLRSNPFRNFTATLCSEKNRKYCDA